MVLRYCTYNIRQMNAIHSSRLHNGVSRLNLKILGTIVPKHRGIMGALMVRIIHNALGEKDRVVSFLVQDAAFLWGVM
jgi:hypothetical protein